MFLTAFPEACPEESPECRGFDAVTAGPTNPLTDVDGRVNCRSNLAGGPGRLRGEWRACQIDSFLS